MSFLSRIKSLFKRSKKPAIERPSQSRPIEPERIPPSAQARVELNCPLAVRDPQYQMKTRGKRPKGYPQGLVVHFTAGSSAESSLSWGRDQGLAFWMIAKDGKTYQTHSLDTWGYHAGKSSYRGIEGTVSDELLGVEIDCAGMLTPKAGKYVSWFGRQVTESNVRFSEGKANQVRGHYEKFTTKQEEALIELCLWLKRNNPKVFSFDLVVGHDEVSPGRKNDPGASLSMTMPEFRALLKQRYHE